MVTLRGILRWIERNIKNRNTDLATLISSYNDLLNIRPFNILDPTTNIRVQLLHGAPNLELHREIENMEQRFMNTIAPEAGLHSREYVFQPPQITAEEIEEVVRNMNVPQAHLSLPLITPSALTPIVDRRQLPDRPYVVPLFTPIWSGRLTGIERPPNIPFNRISYWDWKREQEQQQANLSNSTEEQMLINGDFLNSMSSLARIMGELVQPVVEIIQPVMEALNPLLEALTPETLNLSNSTEEQRLIQEQRANQEQIQRTSMISLDDLERELGGTPEEIEHQQELEVGEMYDGQEEAEYRQGHTHAEEVEELRGLARRQALEPQRINIPAIYMGGVHASFEIVAGHNQDNNVTERNDFLITISNARLKLRSEGYEGQVMIISNQRVKDTAQNISHTYRNIDITELQRIVAHNDFVDWHVDDTLNDFMLFKNAPPNQHTPVGMVRTGILTLTPTYFHARWDEGGIVSEEPGEASNFESCVLETPNRVSCMSEAQVQLNKTIHKLPTKIRRCWMCDRTMSFRECQQANKNLPIKKAMKIWEHVKVRIACCGCTDLLGIITHPKNTLKEVIVHKRTYQKYIVNEDRFIDYKGDIKTIDLIFETKKKTITRRIQGPSENTIMASVSKDQFNKLLENKILELPIELDK